MSEKNQTNKDKKKYEKDGKERRGDEWHRGQAIGGVRETIIL